MRAPCLAVALSFVVGNVIAWGEEGHEAVGYIAMQFLGPKSLSFVQSSLGSTYNRSLGPAATWADTVKYNKGYIWSKPYHYVDANDDPLHGHCSVVVARDSSKGNTILNAISNYTARVRDESLNANQRQEALKFLGGSCMLIFFNTEQPSNNLNICRQFIGDIGQPLHVEAYKNGGNGIKTICADVHTELHATWDTGMIHTMLKAKYGSITAIKPWANDLAAEIKSGSYEASTDGWLGCSSTTQVVSGSDSQSEGAEVIMALLDPAATVPALLACPLVWAKESNAYGCSHVFSYQTGKDLCQGSYFNSAIPIINEQIAKQGYRLAAWLNEIFDGTPMISL